MKKSYEKPIILKLQTGFMNKYGSTPYYSRKTRSEIDGVPIDTLVTKFGSPLMVFSESSIRRTYNEVFRAFSTRYPSVTFGWSYKTNYLKAICSIFHQEGALAEVVSEMEYEKARKLGIPGKNIIFNGPHKPFEILKRAASENSMIHIDHFDELMELEQISQQLHKPVKVGLRLNMETGIHPQWSRFGFNLDTGQALDAVKRMKHGGKLILNGLHCHLGTFILDPQAYAEAIKKMVAFAYEIETHFGFKMEYLDIGGGFPSQNKLKSSYLPPELTILPLDEYAAKITNALYENLRPGDYPRLIIETGRALVDESGYMITTVITSKRLPDGRKAYVVDGGINLLFTSFWYKFNLEIDREVPGVNEPAVVYGPLCMNIDAIDEGTLLPSLPRGARLIVSPIGAYNVTQWMQFIEYRPNVVLIGQQGELDIIREREDLTDIDRREKLPPRLAYK
ncbi:alanine racemase [bacterium]|nr:alanine racemase [bacterium]